MYEIGAFISDPGGAALIRKCRDRGGSALHRQWLGVFVCPEIMWVMTISQEAFTKVRVPVV